MGATTTTPPRPRPQLRPPRPRVSTWSRRAARLRKRAGIPLPSGSFSVWTRGTSAHPSWKGPQMLTCDPRRRSCGSPIHQAVTKLLGDRSCRLAVEMCRAVPRGKSVGMREITANAIVTSKSSNSSISPLNGKDQEEREESPWRIPSSSPTGTVGSPPSRPAMPPQGGLLLPIGCDWKHPS